MIDGPSNWYSRVGRGIECDEGSAREGSPIDATRRATSDEGMDARGQYWEGKLSDWPRAQGEETCTGKTGQSVESRLNQFLLFSRSGFRTGEVPRKDRHQAVARANQPLPSPPCGPAKIEGCRFGRWSRLAEP